MVLQVNNMLPFKPRNLFEDFNTIDRIISRLQDLERKYTRLVEIESPENVRKLYVEYLLKDTEKMENYIENYILVLKTRSQDSDLQKKIHELNDFYMAYKAVRQRIKVENDVSINENI